jgi:hypothetical protein
MYQSTNPVTTMVLDPVFRLRSISEVDPNATIDPYRCSQHFQVSM